MFTTQLYLTLCDELDVNISTTCAGDNLEGYVESSVITQCLTSLCYDGQWGERRERKTCNEWKKEKVEMIAVNGKRRRHLILTFNSFLLPLKLYVACTRRIWGMTVDDFSRSESNWLVLFARNKRGRDGGMLSFLYETSQYSWNSGLPGFWWTALMSFNGQPWRSMWAPTFSGIQETFGSISECHFVAILKLRFIHRGHLKQWLDYNTHVYCFFIAWARLLLLTSRTHWNGVVTHITIWLSIMHGLMRSLFGKNKSWKVGPIMPIIYEGWNFTELKIESFRPCWWLCQLHIDQLMI